jgi:hypothetical protein
MYCKSGRKPKDIPGNPRKVYKDKFNGIEDWLGIADVASYNKKYINFEDARQLTHSPMIVDMAKRESKTHEWFKFTSMQISIRKTSGNSDIWRKKKLDQPTV